MICLTGDLHHMSLRTGNQKACDCTELETAQRFLDMTAEAGVKVTFFVTGKCFAEEWDTLKPICEHPLTSIQGHNYSCYQPELFHRVWKKCTGNYMGPAVWEQRDILQTMEVIYQRTGKNITCWRNHQYMHGPNTDRLLKECGIEICSDGVQANVERPFKHESGLWHFPINVIPDHEHLYHAERTPAWVQWWIERYQWKDDFGSQSYFIEEWTEIVIEQLLEHRKKGSIANLIIHPITMYLCDGFRSYKRILQVLAESESLHMEETWKEEKVGV